MSAFMLSGKHIAALVDAALAKRGDVYRDGKFRLSVVPEKREELCLMLARENAASVAFRYNEKLAPIPESFPFVPYTEGKDTLKLLKAIECYAYQSCEHDGWHGSDAAAFCDALFKRLVHDLPGYDNAPGWVID